MYLLMTGLWVAMSRSVFSYSRGQWYPHSNYFSDFVKQNMWILSITPLSKYSLMLQQYITLMKNNNTVLIWISVLYAIHKRQTERQTRIIQVKIKKSPCIFVSICLCVHVCVCVFNKTESWLPSCWTGPFKSATPFH